MKIAGVARVDDTRGTLADSLAELEMVPAPHTREDEDLTSESENDLSDEDEDELV